MIRRRSGLPKASVGTAAENKVLFEQCILCKRPTEIPMTQPVDSRKNYVTGLGQLCEDCGRLMACGVEENDT